MKFVELKNKGEKELREILLGKREEMRDARFKVSEGQLKNVSTIKKTRRTIARLMTLLNGKRA